MGASCACPAPVLPRAISPRSDWEGFPPLRRPSREFKPGALELEGRRLLTTVPASAATTVAVPAVVLKGRTLLPTAPASTPDSSQSAEFGATTTTAMTTGSRYNPYPVQVVTQQAGEATVLLSRPDTTGSLQVRVTTDPSSPGVGLNVGAVDQTVTFADGQGQAAVTVPILPGAPNPGAVDVKLDIIPPIDPSTNNPTYNPTPLDLRIVASDPTLPPKVVSVYEFQSTSSGTQGLVENNPGIVVTFNKPMDPVEAANVKNYSVSALSLTNHGRSLLGAFLTTSRLALSVNPVRLRSAQYDPTTQSVTLIPKLRNLMTGSVQVVTGVQSAGTSVRRGRQSKVARGLTDLQGNPVNVDTTPGKVGIRITNPGVVGFRGDHGHIQFNPVPGFG